MASLIYHGNNSRKLIPHLWSVIIAFDNFKTHNVQQLFKTQQYAIKIWEVPVFGIPVLPYTYCGKVFYHLIVLICSLVISAASVKLCCKSNQGCCISKSERDASFFAKLKNSRSGQRKHSACTVQEDWCALIKSLIVRTLSYCMLWGVKSDL